MLKKLFAKNVKNEISLYLCDKQLAACHLQNGEVILLAKKVVSSEKQWPEIFTNLVNEFQLSGAQVSVVLDRDFYQTFDIEKPKVDESELLATLPFSIKDLISESIFDQVVDYIDMPFQQRKGEQITVISLPKKRVLAIRDMILKNDCQLKEITIQELALSRLLGSHEEANILLSQHHNELILTVAKGGQLHFTHRLRGFNDLLGVPLNEVEDALVDGLSLEIQRALDYISSQLRINAIGTLYLAVVCPDINLLSEKLGAYLARNVQPFGDEEQYNFPSLVAYGALMSEVEQ